MVRDAVIPSTIQRDVLATPTPVHHERDLSVSDPEKTAFNFFPDMALDFVAGYFGGCAGVIVGHPFDTVKVKLQMQDYRNPMYRGTFDCFAKILKTESVAGVYRGVCSPMAAVAVVNAIVFGVYGNMNRRMDDPNSFKSQFLAGSVAGLAQSIALSPFELVKSRVQVSNEYKGTWDCFKKTYKTEGTRGIFKGLGVTGAREMLGCGLYFATFETLTKREPGEAHMGTMGLLLAGGFTGTVSWVFTYPLDVIKTRLQVNSTKYANFLDCARKSVQEEGLVCLTRGLTPTLIRAFPTNAVTFTVVTWVTRLWEMQASHPGGMEPLLLSLLDSITIKSDLVNNHVIDGHIVKETSNHLMKEITDVMTHQDSRGNHTISKETEVIETLEESRSTFGQKPESNSISNQSRMGGEYHDAPLEIFEPHNNIQR